LYYEAHCIRTRSVLFTECMKEAEAADAQAADLEGHARMHEQAGLFAEAAQQRSAAELMRSHAVAARAAVQTSQERARLAAHSQLASENQELAVRNRLSLLEDAIGNIRNATNAAEEGERLKQQAVDDALAADEAEKNAVQLQDEHEYALKEAEIAEASAESLAAEGRMKESMDAAACAGRYAVTAA
jgi:hypothetical protein